MKVYRIPTSDIKGFYTVMKGNDFENVNPVQKVSELYITSQIELTRNILTLNGFIKHKDWIDSFLLKRAKKNWESEHKKIISTHVPSALFSILECNSKKDQVKALKGLSLTTEELMSFIFKAYENYGFTYSMYSASHYHAGLDKTKLPTLIHKDDNNSIEKVGETKLSNGQLKQVVEHRKVTVSKFLGREDNWHCFFFSYRSLGGKENYHDGQPHLHYISNLWGISREEVLAQLKSKKYRLPSLPHIDFHTHRNPRKE